MDHRSKRILRHNYLMIVLDGLFFGTGFGFASYAAILPLFVSQLTTSAVLIGLIPALHNAFIQLPQLFLAKRVARIGYLKPFVIAIGLVERTPFLLMAILAYFLPNIHPPTALVLIFVILIIQSIGAGLTANPWQVWVAKLLPSDIRGTFFGVLNSASNLGGSLSAILAGLILQNISSPKNYALTLLFGFLWMAIGVSTQFLTKETPVAIPDGEFHSLPLMTNIRKIFKADVPFRWFIFSRILTQLGMMSFAFLIIYGVFYHHMTESMSGLMVSILMISQMISSPIFGWFADRWGKKRILILGAATTTIAPLLAWLLPDIRWYPLVMILMGISSTIFWNTGIAYTIDFGTDESRPLYIGLANTLIAPSAILAPVIGGMLADAFGYPVTFAVSAVLAFISIIPMVLFVREHNRFTVYHS